MEDGRRRMVLSVAIGTGHIDGHPPRLLRYDRETDPNSITRQGGAPHVCSKQVLSNRRVVTAKDLSSGGSARRPARAPKQRRNFAKKRAAGGQHCHTAPKNSLPSATGSGI